MQKYDGKWLVGVSGGSDSMALLSMCLEEGMDVSVAFVNYHVRKESLREEEYIKEYCKENNITCYIKNDAFTYTGNFEAAARKYRYDFFKECVLKYDLKGVLLAHQEDDLLETYFMQEESGIEPSFYGLKEEMIYEGMVVRRPLLNYTKKELIEYCNEHQIQYFIDSTNEDESYTRNRIRHQVVEPLSRNDRDLVLSEIEKKNAIKQERLCRIDAYIKQKEISLDLYRQLDKDDRYTLLFELCKHIKNVSLKEREMMDMTLCHKNDFMIPVGEEYIVQDNGNFFLFNKRDAYEDIYEKLEDIHNGVHGAYKIEEGSMGVNAVSVSEDDFPLMIRSYKEGDSIKMRFGTKKVNRFFIDRKIPLYKRDLWPIVCNRDNEVILVPGLGCNIAHFSIKPNFNVIQYIEM